MLCSWPTHCDVQGQPPDRASQSRVCCRPVDATVLERDLQARVGSGPSGATTRGCGTGPGAPGQCGSCGHGGVLRGGACVANKRKSGSSLGARTLHAGGGLQLTD